MLPRLAAEETLEAATATALGSGILMPADAARIRNALAREAGARRIAPASPLALAMMGIAVEVVEAPAAEGRGDG